MQCAIYTTMVSWQAASLENVRENEDRSFFCIDTPARSWKMRWVEGYTSDCFACDNNCVQQSAM